MWLSGSGFPFVGLVLLHLRRCCLIQALALSSLLRAPSLRERGSLSLTASLPFPLPIPASRALPGVLVVSLPRPYGFPIRQG